ncbi:hypothetical protein ACT3UD_18060 [Glutamicibacter sp. 287]|uniref:hypothetical protein n=1 Tax=unclassified Glutamicibacter TaxID=2627139 RepID=UPI0026938D2B
MFSSNYSEPMFIGIWESKSSMPADRSLSDPVSFLNDYSELLWGPESSSAGRAWVVNDAGRGEDFHHSENAPDVWFQVGIQPASANSPLPCYALAVMTDTFRCETSKPPVQVDFAVPLQQLKNLNPGALPSEGLSGVVALESSDERRRDISVEFQSGQKDAFPDEVLNALVSQIASVLMLEVTANRIDSTKSLPISDGIWDGPGASSALISFSSGLHSLTAIGWMTGLLADILASYGVDRPVYISWKFCDQTGN